MHSSSVSALWVCELVPEVILRNVYMTLVLSSGRCCLTGRRCWSNPNINQEVYIYIYSLYVHINFWSFDGFARKHTWNIKCTGRTVLCVGKIGEMCSKWSSITIYQGSTPSKLTLHLSASKGLQHWRSLLGWHGEWLQRRSWAGFGLFKRWTVVLDWGIGILGSRWYIYTVVYTSLGRAGGWIF